MPFSTVASSSSLAAADQRWCSLSELAALADDAVVNSGLLYKSSSKHADRLYEVQQRLVWYSRWLAAASFLSAGAAGVLGYHQYAKVYRVWRMRYPGKVRRCFQGMVAFTGLSLACLLYLLSPIGFMAAHHRHAQRARGFDRLAFESLLLQQNYATLHAFCVLREANNHNHPRRMGKAKADSKAALRRRVLSVNDAAYTEVSIARRPPPVGECECGNGEVRSGPATPAKPLPDKEEATHRWWSRKGGRGPSSGGGGGTANGEERDVYTFAQSEDEEELWRCYGALSDEWGRLTEAQRTLEQEVR